MKNRRMAVVGLMAASASFVGAVALAAPAQAQTDCIDPVNASFAQPCPVENSFSQNTDPLFPGDPLPSGTGNPAVDAFGDSLGTEPLQQIINTPTTAPDTFVPTDNGGPSDCTTFLINCPTAPF